MSAIKQIKAIENAITRGGGERFIEHRQPKQNKVNQYKYKFIQCNRKFILEMVDKRM